MKRLLSETGQDLVEYAITLVIYFTVILFIFDGGIAMWRYVTLSHAVREGTRYAITHGQYCVSPCQPQGPANDTDIKNTVVDWAFGMEDTVLRPRITVTWVSNDNHIGHRVTVTAGYPLSSITGLFWGGTSLNIQTLSTMEIQS
jgi:Flp pilus assembly protein TadG